MKVFLIIGIGKMTIFFSLNYKSSVHTLLKPIPLKKTFFFDQTAPIKELKMAGLAVLMS